jgi:Zn-dependent membrane protease YugP
MIAFRNLMIKTSNIASVILWPLVIIGLIFNLAVVGGGLFGNICLWAGIGFFGISILLNLITLPVEYNASNRAKEIMKKEGLLTPTEQQGAEKVLNAAALTYVAALLVSISYLVRFLLVVLLNSKKRD